MNVETALDLHQDDIFENEWMDVKDIEIITLNQYLEDLAATEAWTMTNNVNEIDNLIDKLRKITHNHANEFIDIQPHKIVIGLNCDEIHKETIEYAINLLAQIEDLEDCKRIEL